MTLLSYGYWIREKGREGESGMRICRIDLDTGWCLGCKRTVDEIARWMAMDDTARQKVIDQLPSRHA